MATIAIFVIVFCSIYMRIFKYPSLFIKAFNATKREMLVSVIILILVTFVLAFGLYIAEVRVRLEYSFWDAMVWNFGMSNKNFRVNFKGRSYVLRVPGNGSDGMVERSNEEFNALEGCKMGVNPVQDSHIDCFVTTLPILSNIIVIIL